MQIHCPLCGLRDRREFYYLGEALNRPDPEADDAAWDAYLHLRENSAAERDELWCHEAGCGAWLRVTRNTTTHTITSVRLAKEVTA